MKKLTYLAMLSLVTALVMAPPALAQQQIYPDLAQPQDAPGGCADYATQPEAQAAFEGGRTPLDGDGDGIACERYFGGPDLDCNFFATQPEAQAVLDQDPSDPYYLDGNGDGVACDALFGTPDAAQLAATGGSSNAADVSAQAEAGSGEGELPPTGGGTAHPDTGGMLVGTALLLLSCGVLGVVAYRRAA